jgi:hypothetical protein
MRAFNTTLVKYVDWVVNDAPDSTGVFSGYPTNQLVNITVNRIVQSKVANFLKQNQSLGGTDGYYFHVNSYDWRNAVTPIAPPTNLTGFAVERGVSSISSVTNASNASPINITASVPHGLATGQIVTINGVTGNTAANGSWPIIVTSPTNFTITGSVGNGAYVSGGSIFVPTTFSTLTWDEINNVWRFVTNPNGDGTTLGVSQDLKVNNFIMDGYLAIGPDPADTGAIRLSNNAYIFSERNPTGTDIQLIGADTFNRIKLGSLVSDIVYAPGVMVVDGYVQHDSTSGNLAASTGFIRELNNTAIVAFKNVNQAFSDITTLSSNNFNQIVVGDTVNTGTVHNTATASFNITAATAASPVQITVSAPTTFVTGQSVNIAGITGTIGTDPTNGLNGKTFSIVVLNTTQFTLTGSNGTGLAYTSGGTASTNNVHAFQEGGVTQVEIGTSFIRFPAVVTAPFLTQTTATGSNSGQNLTIQSQNAGLGGTNGGNLTLTTGTGATNGILNLVIGTTTRVTLNDTTETHFHPTISFAANQPNPLINQISTTVAPTTLTIAAQATTQAATAGGVLNLTSGNGTSTSGNVNVQTGGTNQIIVSPTFITPGTTTSTGGSVVIRGSLEVVGTTTTVDSTVVDIIGRVIHANWADPVASPNVAVPSQVVGYSIHRGNSSGVPRDAAAMIWTEGALNSGADGYWRYVTYPGDGIGTDNFVIGNSLNAVGTMANDFTASTDPNPILGFLASTGSFRAANNVPTVVGRSNQATTTLTGAPLVNGTFTLPFVAATVTVIDTTNFTTSGSLLVQSSAGSQTVTYTGKTGTTFIGVNGGAGNIVTGGIVAQTNASTTYNGTNGVAIGASIVVVTNGTVGFPAAGTLRVVTHTSNSATAPVSVQTVTYTSTSGGNTFNGVSAATGFLFVGDAVTSIPSPGISDLPLVSTDFGNRVLHGFNTSPTGNVINNTGHIFNTPTSFFYDFQVNSVTQVRLGEADTDASGFAETIEIGPTVSNPRLVQQTLPNTGATNGFNLGVFAQAGQLQTGGNNNNNGGLLILSSGAQGLGGAGTAGIDGYVELRTGFTSKVRVFPTDASPVGSSGDDNSILYFESLFRVDSAQTGAGPLAGTGVRFRQDDTGSGVGATYTIQAQSAATTGGNLVLISGTGSTAANAGQVKLATGLTAGLTPTAIDRVIVYPTGSPVLPQGPSNVTYTEFRDTAQAVFITPVFNGISSLGFASTVTGVQIAQVAATATNGAPMTIQSQVTTLNAGTGGALSVIAGNATGTTTTGGALNLASGSGTTTNGVINFQPGGTTQILITATGQFLQWVSTMANPTLNQVTTGGASGTTLTVQAQNAATTGGNLTLTSGTATTAGDVNIQTGAVSRVIVHPTFTEFRDTAEALRITPVSAGSTLITFAATDTAATINQTQTAATPSATMTIQSQVTTAASGQGGNLTLIAGNATGTTATGGNGILTSGTGTTVAGNVQLQTGAVDRVVVHPTFTEFRDAAEAYRITPVSAGTTTLQAASTVTALTYRQADLATNGGTGATTTLQAQNETGTTSNGGPLVLTSGTGTTAAGNVSIQTGAVDKIIVHPAFTEFRDTAEALRITPVSAGTTQITFASTDTAAQVNQTTTGGATGATMTVQAQNAATTGGSLNLTSGTGTTAGNVNLQVGGVTNASVTDSKFVMNKGWRRNVTAVSTTYQVLVSDEYIAATTSSAYTVTMPAAPTTGDTHTFKDVSGGAGTNTLTISGNGTNIDGSASIVLNQAYAAVTLTFTGSQWSVT